MIQWQWGLPRPGKQRFFGNNGNAIESVAEKTGIGLPRLKEIYYRTGAPEAYELLLIEKAIGKTPGEIFKEFLVEKLDASIIVNLLNKG